MTEAIKQWIADQTLVTYPDYKGPHEAIKSEVMKLQETYAYGLTKGLEIAEGFAQWVEELYIQDQKGKWYTYHRFAERFKTDSVEFFTTSQLLEIYLKTLEP